MPEDNSIDAAMSPLMMASRLDCQITLWAIGMCPLLGCLAELEPEEIFCPEHEAAHAGPVDIVDRP